MKATDECIAKESSIDWLWIILRMSSSLNTRYKILRKNEGLAYFALHLVQ